MASQKTIEINNFAQMLPEVPQGSQRNQHFLIANANPIYYKGLGATIQEEQFAPLYASAKKDIANGTLVLNGNITHLFQDKGWGLGEFFVATENGYLYYKDVSNLWLSFPSIGTVGNTSLRGFVYFSDSPKIFLHSNFTAIRWIDSITGSWTIISGLNILNSTISQRQAEVFKADVIISDGNSVLAYPRFLRIMDASLTLTSDANSLDLGAGVACRGLKNYNDKYLAIAVGNANNPLNYDNNFLYLWDANQVLGFNYSVKIPGLFQGMEVIKGILYVLVGEKSGQSALYYLAGTILKKVYDINYGYPSTTPEYNLFSYYGMLGINLDTGLLVWDREDGVKFFLNQDAVTMYVQGQSGLDIYSGLDTTLYKETGTTFNNLKYQSQYFEVSGNLDNVEIFYDQPPTASNKISVYADTIDENQPVGSIANSTTQLVDIDSITALNSKRTVLDGKGVLFSKIRIRITSTGNWNCIIRKIKINYSPVTGQ